MLSMEPQIDLELDEGERIIYCARRHWIVLVLRGFIFLLIGVTAAALAIYRAVGGNFIVGGVVQEGQFDLLSIILLGLIALLALLWWVPRLRNPKKPPRGIPYLVGIALLFLTFYFRFRGGRLLYINPLESSKAGDVFNLLLFLITLAMIGVLAYIAIDWANDFLILTNTRVVYDDQQLLVRHVVQQILIENIQQVVARAESYPEHWLDYGTIVIRSLSPRRLVFSNARHPQVMLQKILAEVNKLRRQQEPELLRHMIEDQVYGNKLPPVPRMAIQVEERPGLIPWLFSTNPEIDFEREIVIWRPFWLFLVIAMLRPVGLFLAVSIALAFLLQLELISGGLALVLWIPVTLGCAFWVFWIREEHEHDLYILTRQDITDVDKKPFGPENRRRAPLGAIQDVSYDVSYTESLLGYGNVIIETGGAGGGRFTFKHVPDPRGVEATINDYLTDFRKRDKERQLQDTVALIKQYHDAQRTHDELVNREQLLGMIAERVAAESVQQPGDTLPWHRAREVTPPLPRRIRREVRATERDDLWRARWFRRRR